MLNQKSRARWRTQSHRALDSPTIKSDALGLVVPAHPPAKQSNLLRLQHADRGDLGGASVRPHKTPSFAVSARYCSSRTTNGAPACLLHDAKNCRAIERRSRRRPSGYRRLICPANAMSRRELHHVGDTISFS
jgi:hypothetical protein